MRGKVAKRLRKEVIIKRKTYDQLKKEHMHTETKVWIKKTKRQMRKLGICILMTVVSLSSVGQKKSVMVIDSSKIKTDSIIYLSLKMPLQNWNALLQLIKTSDEKPSMIKSFTEYILQNLKKDEKQN